MDPHPVIVIIMDNKDYSRVLLYPHHATITGWGDPENVEFRCKEGRPLNVTQ